MAEAPFARLLNDYAMAARATQDAMYEYGTHSPKHEAAAFDEQQIRNVIEARIAALTRDAERLDWLEASHL